MLFLGAVLVLIVAVAVVRARARSNQSSLTDVAKIGCDAEGHDRYAQLGGPAEMSKGQPGWRRYRRAIKH